MRRTLTASTLLLGETGTPPSALDLGDEVMYDDTSKPGNLHDFVLGIGGCKGSKGAKGRVIEWINCMGPTSNQGCGHDLSVKSIWNLLCEKESAYSKLKELEEQYEGRCVQILKAEQIQLAKWSRMVSAESSKPVLLPSLDAKKIELEAWRKGKISEAFTSVQCERSKIERVDLELDKAVDHLIALLEGPGDEVCRELLQELDSKFGELTLTDAPLQDPQEPLGDETDGVPHLNAATRALTCVQKLDNGPEKRAMMAVLEVAATSPVEAQCSKS